MYWNALFEIELTRSDDTLAMSVVEIPLMIEPNSVSELELVVSDGYWPEFLVKLYHVAILGHAKLILANEDTDDLI